MRFQSTGTLGLYHQVPKESIYKANPRRDVSPL